MSEREQEIKEWEERMAQDARDADAAEDMATRNRQEREARKRAAKGLER